MQKRMKTLIALLAVLALVGLLPLTASAKDSASADLSGDWEAFGAWVKEGGGPWGPSTWSIQMMKGPLFKIATGEGDTGMGFLVGTLVLFRTDGTGVPLFIGLLTDDQSAMMGVAVQTETQVPGIWEANRTVPVAR